MADRVELAFRRAASDLLPDSCSVLAAVSGGGDSVALLHLLRRYSRRRGIVVTVAHLDHGLRRGSVADRTFVERLARELSCPCISDRRPVAELRRKGESPEEGARRVRRAFLIEAARQAGATRIATGHTLDDQAETVLMRLVRGAGATALTGMAVEGPGPFVRPLLELERVELRAYLERRGHAFRDDPTNRDLRFDRNRTRHLLLPVITETLNPRAARLLVQAADRLRQDALYLDRLADECYSRVARPGRQGRLSLDVPVLRELPLPLATRVARLSLEHAGADPRRVSARHVEALLDLARAGSGRRLDLPGRLVATRNGSRILLCPPR